MKNRLEHINDLLKSVPEAPGCYQMKDKDGVIIYVGKAKNLKRRVTSYFRGAHDYKTTKMVSLVHEFEYIITNSDLEAYVLENNLIKKYDPKYNIKQTDDKTYPYICITNEANSRLLYTRNVNKKIGRFYGPYPNQSACKEVCERLNKIYPFRKCVHIPKKECLYYHLHQCLAPCINKVEKSDYEEYIARCEDILKGNVKEEIKRVTALMEEASSRCDFEKAIEYRNFIDDLKSVSEKQNMEGYLNECDIFGYFINDNYLSIQVFHIRDGKILERNGYLKSVPDDLEEALTEFIVYFYTIDNNPTPKTIYAKDIDFDLAEELIGHAITKPVRGKYKDLLELVCKNASQKIEEILKKEELEYRRSDGAVKDLEELIGLSGIHTMEAFDNSNIMGADPVSCCVVYIDGKRAPKLYRRYKVKTVVGANDVGTMQEVVKRRYEKNPTPDLLIMDGGKGQVDYAKLALQEIGKECPILGLVKDDNHKTRALFFNDKEISIDKNSYAFKLLYDIQEEVHRFAISYFHSRHTKSQLFSKLDKIEGIGKVKKERILNMLGSDNLEEELKTVPLNDEQIKQVLEVFRR